MKVDIDIEKLYLVANLMNQILPAYNSDGYTKSDYYENIILPDLSEKEFKNLKEICEGDFK